MDGFIAIHRKILEWEWYTDANTMRVFLHCLLKANYETRSWRGTTIERGQFVTSVKSLSQELDLTPKQIQGALDKLKRTNEVAIKTSNKNSTITICKYDDYQILESGEGKTKGKTNGNTNGKQEVNQRENKGQQQNKETTIINKQYIEKSDTNVSPKETPQFDFKKILIETYAVPECFVNDWIIVRKQKRAANTESSIKALVREAMKAGISVAAAVQMCAENGWQGFRAEYLHNGRTNRPTPTPHTDDAERARKEAEIEQMRQEKLAEREQEREFDAQNRRDKETKRLNDILGI